MQSQYQAHFPPGKIKKIIQSNQDVGKLANSIPHLMEHSLQIFLNNILDNVNDIATQQQYNKVTPSILKAGLIKSNKYKFMLPFLNEIEDEDGPKRKRQDSENSKAKKKKKGNDDE